MTVNHNNIIREFTSLLAKVLHELDQESEEMRKALRSLRFFTSLGVLVAYILIAVAIIIFLLPRFWAGFSPIMEHLLPAQWTLLLQLARMLILMTIMFAAIILLGVPFVFLDKRIPQKIRLACVVIQTFLINPFWWGFLATLLDWWVNPEFVFSLSSFITGYLLLLLLLFISWFMAIVLLMIFSQSIYLSRWLILMLSTSFLPKIEGESETTPSSRPSQPWLSHDELTARVIEKTQVDSQNWSETMRKVLFSITEQRLNYLNSQIQTASFILVTLTLFGLVPVIFPDGVKKIFETIALFLNLFSSSQASIENIQSWTAIVVFVVIMFGLWYFSRAYKTIRALEIIQIMLTIQEPITNQPVPASNPSQLPTPIPLSPVAQSTTWAPLLVIPLIGLGLLSWLIQPRNKNN